MQVTHNLPEQPRVHAYQSHTGIFELNWRYDGEVSVRFPDQRAARQFIRQLIDALEQEAERVRQSNN